MRVLGQLRNRNLPSTVPPILALLRCCVCTVLALLAFAHFAAAQDKTSYFRTIVIEPGPYKGEITCILCSVVVKGDVEGEVVTVGGDVTVYGRVREDIVTSGGSVHLKNGAEATGDIVAVGGLITTAGSVTTPGKDGYVAIPWVYVPGQLSVGWRGALALLGFHFVCVLLPVALLRPRRVRNVTAASRRWVITGLLGAVAIALFSYLFDWMDNHFHSSDAFEVIGVTLFTLLLAIGLAGITLVVGEKFFSGNLFKALAAGTIVLVILELIPIVGFLVLIVASCWAMGAALWSGLGFRPPRPPKNAESSSVLKLTP